MWPPSQAPGPSCQRARRDAPRAERIEPSLAEQPGRARVRASLELQATTVENNNAMLVVMKMLMRSDTP